MKCDRCDKEAVVNYQKAWKRFGITKDEEYIEDKQFDPLYIDEPSGDDNLHFCKDHNIMFISVK